MAVKGAPRTFKLDVPHMKGSDVEDWQQWLLMTFRRWDIDYPLTDDGDYGQATRSATASACMALGLASAESAMKDGVTPALRTKLRNRRLTPAERVRMGTVRVKYRAALRQRYQGGGVAMPVNKVIEDSWGWHPGVHDGLDLICMPNAELHAMCAGTIVRADPSGWWGLGRPADPELAGKGDGIIILSAAHDVGPIKRGMHLCYGHAEHATVRVGQHVKAGQRIGQAGLANAWHVHFMVNDDPGARGVGDRDPRPIYEYARRHA